MLRVVLDTSIIASGFIAPIGPPGKSLVAWRERRLDIVVSPVAFAALLEPTG